MDQLKKQLFVVVLLVMGYIHVGAQDMVPGIIVELSSGKKVEFRLADNPKIVFDGQTIKLTADGINVEYTPTEFVKLTTGEVQNNASGITELTSHQENIAVKDGYVCLNGFNSNDAVSVFSVDGKLVATYHIPTNGSISIPISTLPSGISIIRTNNQSIKIIKR